LQERFFKAIDAPQKIEYIDMPGALKGKYQYHTCAEMGRTRKALGKEADCMSIDASVNDYINNHLISGKSW